MKPVTGPRSYQQQAQDLTCFLHNVMADLCKFYLLFRTYYLLKAYPQKADGTNL